jgi:hypothetical protein
MEAPMGNRLPWVEEWYCCLKAVENPREEDLESLRRRVAMVVLTAVSAEKRPESMRRSKLEGKEL